MTTPRYSWPVRDEFLNREEPTSLALEAWWAERRRPQRARAHTGAAAPASRGSSARSPTASRPWSSSPTRGAPGQQLSAPRRCARATCSPFAPIIADLPALFRALDRLAGREAERLVADRRVPLPPPRRRRALGREAALRRAGGHRGGARRLPPEADPLRLPHRPDAGACSPSKAPSAAASPRWPSDPLSLPARPAPSSPADGPQEQHRGASRSAGGMPMYLAELSGRRASLSDGASASPCSTTSGPLFNDPREVLEEEVPPPRHLLLAARGARRPRAAAWTS